MTSFVEFSLVDKCCNVCKFCPQDVLTLSYKGRKQMTLTDFKTIIDKIPKSTISIAGFSEPFVNQGCTDMIEYATEKGHSVIVYTTLVGMTIPQYDRLKKNYGVKSLVIHLPDKEGNTKIKITEEYKQLLRYICMYPIGSWCKVDYSIHGSAVHSDLIDIIRVNHDYRIHDRAGVLRTDDKSVHKVHWKSGQIVCTNGFGSDQSGIIMPNGDTYFCCMNFDLKESHKLGNIFNQTWEELMQSEPRERLFKDRISGEYQDICRHCVEAQMGFIRWE